MGVSKVYYSKNYCHMYEDLDLFCQLATKLDTSVDIFSKLSDSMSTRTLFVKILIFRSKYSYFLLALYVAGPHLEVIKEGRSRSTNAVRVLVPSS